MPPRLRQERGVGKTIRFVICFANGYHVGSWSGLKRKGKAAHAMTSDYKNDDIDRVKREEEQRGKRRPPPDEEKLKEQRDREREHKILLRSMDRQQIEKAIRALGLKPGMPEYEELVQAWRQYQKSL